MDNAGITYLIEDDIRALMPLIKLLKDFSEGRACSVLEVTLLEEFPPTEVLLPVDRFSPRQIIEKMMEKHKRTVQNVWENPENLETIVVEYKLDAKRGKIGRIEFTNNMEFYADLQIICYYHTFKYNIQNKSLQDITKMLMKKYGINTERADNRAAITFRRIMYSFPSITLDMFRMDAYSHYFRVVFAEIKLPRAIYSPVIVSILPMLNDPPIAILTAIALKMADAYTYYNTFLPKIPIATIYQCVIMSYTSTVFPERLKLQLCKRWGIVVIKENEYDFHPNFKAFRNEAKELISIFRSKDPDLKDVLSKV